MGSGNFREEGIGRKDQEGRSDEVRGVNVRTTLVCAPNTGVLVSFACFVSCLQLLYPRVNSIRDFSYYI